MNSEENFVRERVLVVPGDELCDDSLRPGMGTYLMNGKIYAAKVGIVSERSGYMNVNPIKGRYMPRQGDSVIGVVADVGPSSWLVDINSAYPALLHINEVSWKVEYGNTANFLKPGDVLLAKIISVDETKKVQITIKEHGLRKLDGGQLVKIPYTKVPRVIGKSGSMISMLKHATDTRMFVGQNGYIWIDGGLDGIRIVSEAVEIINNKTQVTGLTDEIRRFLEDCKLAGEPGTPALQGDENYE